MKKKCCARLDLPRGVYVLAVRRQVEVAALLILRGISNEDCVVIVDGGVPSYIDDDMIDKALVGENSWPPKASSRKKQPTRTAQDLWVKEQRTQINTVVAQMFETLPMFAGGISKTR